MQQQQQTLDEKGLLQATYAFLERAKLEGIEVKVFNQCINYLEIQYAKVDQKIMEAEKKEAEKLEPSLPSQKKPEEKAEEKAGETPEVKQLVPEKLVVPVVPVPKPVEKA